MGWGCPRRAEGCVAGLGCNKGANGNRAAALFKPAGQAHAGETKAPPNPGLGASAAAQAGSCAQRLTSRERRPPCHSCRCRNQRRRPPSRRPNGTRPPQLGSCICFLAGSVPAQQRSEAAPWRGRHALSVPSRLSLLGCPAADRTEAHEEHAFLLASGKSGGAAKRRGPLPCKAHRVRRSRRGRPWSLSGTPPETTGEMLHIPKSCVGG